jgi:hypothetical protein
MAKNPSTTIVPSITGSGIAALLLPLCRIESSTTLSMAEIIKQQLQIKTILENVRIKKSYEFMSYELRVEQLYFLALQIIAFKIYKACSS